MRYKFLLMEDSAEKLDVVLETDDLDVAAEVRSTILKVVAPGGTPGNAPAKNSNVIPRKRGAKGRPVCVVSVEEDNGTSYRSGDYFDSAMQLSESMGFSYNAVSVALAQAKRKSENRAVINGVEFAYVDDYVRD